MRRRGRIALSDDVLREIAQVFVRPKIVRRTTPAIRDAILDRLVTGATFFAPAAAIAACRDPKDDEYLELALAASADASVTGDADLLALHPFRGIPVLTPAAFLDAFGA